jgi:tetratricopeptide (TPR) repeat protein
VAKERSLVLVLEGHVVVTNNEGQLILAPGQAATAEADKAPSLRTLVRPRDAVQWALYYPPVLYIRPHELLPGLGQREKVRQSIEFYRGGDFQKAFKSIAAVPEMIREPRFFTYRAALLLTVGRVDKANSDIKQALRLAPKDSNALALQAVIAVVQNDKDKALQVAQQAVKTAPDSATAWIALSYAQQAKFDLSNARASLHKAVRLDPKNALAWARLAELWSSFGGLDQALSAAQKAVVLAPNLSRTQTVLGFAYLTQVKTAKAKETFAKAIVLDQADPLPRLGLGLAKIREGELHEGRREIEAAASLNPNDAIVRSYLGKAYYEEKRLPLSEREYTTAKELDPNDPTPWFYDAIAKQTTNRPVEALQNLEKSMALNDDRAVYRSRLLLDSDLAARSASLGRIYEDLGFQQLALVEGWKSVNTDPSNFSAHRLLADSYAALPRHEIARVSELLQSQLLQPLNVTPMQPRLGESNLFLIRAGGPSRLSFNEFNSLFNRDRRTLLASSLLGENGTFGGDSIVSGIHKETSFSIGLSHFETDGFRNNSHQKDTIFNAFVQQELTPDTSIQAEYRYRDNNQGDLQQRFFPADVFPTLTDRQERHSFRLGARHGFTPTSILLGSFIYQDAETRLSNDDFPEPGSFIDLEIPEKAFGGELLTLFRLPQVNLKSGLGYFTIDAKIDTTIGFTPLENSDEPITVQSTVDEDIRHLNFYTYADFNLLENVTASLGASFDSVTGDLDKNQFNPKFGITWDPLPGTTIRAAVLKTLKRTLINDQTLEPTQVAGFNQFFDDANLTETWRYGGAIDQKFSNDLFAGVEVSKRDLTVPFLEVSDDGAQLLERATNWDEYLGRTYLFWTPHPWLALSADYWFEHYDREERFAAGIRKLDTHRVLLGINLSDPSGLSASLMPTYWNQDGKLERFIDPTVVQFGRDDFWTMDAEIGYRLPQRYGFISVGATNLFDENFKFFEIDVNNPTVQPARTFFIKFTLAFP